MAAGGTISPFARPLYVMTKPVGASCNMQCEYCYYDEKRYLHGGGRMSDRLTEIFIKEYIGAQTMDEVMFTWHGGEPTLQDLDYYRKVVRWQREYADGRRILNCLQTNGTLLDDHWCHWLAENRWLVGISIDGPEHLHDKYRKWRGGPSWARVMQSIDLLEKYGAEWNAMAVVTDDTTHAPQEFYRFFRDELRCRFLQFSPVVEREMTHADGRHLAHMLDADCPVTGWSVTPEGWGRFLCEVFDEWVRRDVGEMFVQIFDATLANWMGMTPGVCTLSDWCGHAAVMEHTGEVYCCDHFVFPEYRLGNVQSTPLVSMVYGEKMERFARMKSEVLPNMCRECKWHFACHGECPRNRFAKTSGGEAGLNYLCEGYRMFFEHVEPYMDYMRQELLHGRDASGVMQAF